MKPRLETAEIFVPDNLPVDQALARTTHLAVSAHQDDLEIMAFDGVLKAFQQPDKWFTGVVVTDGAGSPRELMAELTRGGAKPRCRPKNPCTRREPATRPMPGTKPVTSPSPSR